MTAAVIAYRKMRINVNIFAGFLVILRMFNSGEEEVQEALKEVQQIERVSARKERDADVERDGAWSVRQS